MERKIQESFQESIKIIEKTSSLESEIIKSVKILEQALKKGKKIVLFGNGGSAADSQHIAAELIGRFNKERKSLAAIALSTDSSIITSIGNDYSFDKIFSRQCESLINRGDVAIGISTSGNSKNVINAINVTKKKGGYTIGLLGGNGGKISKIVNLAIIVDSKSTARIQEAHRVIYHIICENLEEIMSKK